VKWTRGFTTVDNAITEGRLERISGTAADGHALLNSAHELLASAQRECDQNPEAAYTLAYDAARKAATGLLAQQGLRPKGIGHHVTVEQVVRAQFGGVFEEFGMLRRRRGEIEYPQRPGDDVYQGEAVDAIASATRITDAAGQLLDQLSLYI
jgi:hypothetical protein